MCAVGSSLGEGADTPLVPSGFPWHCSGVGHGKRPALARNSYSGYDNSVTVSKVSLSIEADVLEEARERAGRRELSSYVTDALRRQLQHDRIEELLAEMDTRSGPIADDLMEEARQLWRGPAADKPKSRRSA
jgi:hypothetical protein